MRNLVLPDTEAVKRLWLPSPVNARIPLPFVVLLIVVWKFVVVVPMPTFPFPPIYNAVANVPSPPALRWILKLPLLYKFSVFAGAFPVGTANARFPAILAVGVPLLLLIKANFAVLVAVPPTNRSSVV